jgi:hypothetical protein
MDGMVVACNDSVLGRILPRAQALETKLFLVIGKCAAYVHSEKHGDYLANHPRSLLSATLYPLAGLCLEAELASVVAG